MVQLLPTPLSNVLLHQMNKGDAVAATALEKVSPVAWQHINFYGRYEFTKSVQAIVGKKRFEISFYKRCNE